MKKILEKILSKMYGYEAIKMKDIKIKPSYKNVSDSKLKQKRDYAEKYGIFKETIIIDECNCLIDGYTTYLLALEDGIDEIYAMRFIK